jgi:beta-lactamase class A
MRPNLQFQRRALIVGAGASALAVGYARGADRTAPEFGHLYWLNRISALERSMGGRLGIFARYVGRDNLFGHRDNERFPMCSTFKLSLVGAVLEAADAGRTNLHKRLAYGPADLLEYAPVSRAHAAEGSLSVADLCKATVELSDNTAANLLLTEIDGPASLTARWRVWGDKETRLDRNEPTLHSSIPGDRRDTTTPMAMAQTMQALLVGTTLKLENRERLLGWVRNCQTGLTKLRAGLPAGLIVGDKTGNNAKDTMGDIAVVEAKGSPPLLIACYLTEAKVDAKAQDAVFVEVARIISEFYQLGRPAYG